LAPKCLSLGEKFETLLCSRVIAEDSAPGASLWVRFGFVVAGSPWPVVSALWMFLVISLCASNSYYCMSNSLYCLSIITRDPSDMCERAGDGLCPTLASSERIELPSSVKFSVGVRLGPCPDDCVVIFASQLDSVSVSGC
jgi:hypothetical protein